MMLGVREAAALLGVPENAVYRWSDQGLLPVHRVEEEYRFHRAELLEWATAHQMQVSPALCADSEPDSPTLAAALEAGGVFYRVPGAEKLAVLRAVVDLLPVSEEVDRDFLFQVLLARETLGSTAVGDGVAIPHVRNPLVLNVPRPSASLCFLDRPIPFGALDNQPVHTLFILLSPTIRTHLHLLSRLAFLLKKPELQVELRKRTPAAQIVKVVRALEQALPPTGVTR